VKRAVIYILLSFYVFAQVKPLAVIVEDVLAHTLWRAQHMATVHFENGHYHIHNELSDVSEKENKSAQNKAPSSEKMNENTFQNIHELNFNFQTNSILTPVTIFQTQDVLAGFTTINSPPPKKA
jgi:Zn-finger protein